MYFFSLYKKISHGREGKPLMGSFHTRKLSFFLYCVFLSEAGDRKHVEQEEVCSYPPEGTRRPVYSNTPGPGRLAEDRAIYIPKGTEEEAERIRTTARLQKPGWDDPSTFPVPSWGRPGDSQRLAPLGDARRRMEARNWPWGGAAGLCPGRAASSLAALQESSLPSRSRQQC